MKMLLSFLGAQVFFWGGIIGELDQKREREREKKKGEREGGRRQFNLFSV